MAGLVIPPHDEALDDLPLTRKEADMKQRIGRRECKAAGRRDYPAAIWYKADSLQRLGKQAAKLQVTLVTVPLSDLDYRRWGWF